MANKYNFNGGERSSLVGDLYIAERLHTGTATKLGGATYTDAAKTKYMLKDKGYAISGAIPGTAEVQLFEDGGSVISGTVRNGGTAAKNIYLGNPLVYDTEHTFEGGVTSAKLEKNKVILADDVSGFSMMIKCKIANIAEQDIQELMFVSKTDSEGVRNASATPSTSAYNRIFLVSLVEKLANGDFNIIQARNCRINIALPTGGGEAHKTAEVTITPMMDPWARPLYNHMANLVLTGATIV